MINAAQTSYITADNSDILHFFTAGAERMTIGASGERSAVWKLVFKTSGGFEQSSQWVRFPYTPA